MAIHTIPPLGYWKRSKRANHRVARPEREFPVSSRWEKGRRQLLMPFSKLCEDGRSEASSCEILRLNREGGMGRHGQLSPCKMLGFPQYLFALRTMIAPFSSPHYPCAYPPSPVPGLELRIARLDPAPEQVCRPDRP